MKDKTSVSRDEVMAKKLSFAFEYVGLTSSDMGCGHWVAAGEPQWALFGRLTSGRIAVGQKIELPTAAGALVQGYVARFADSLSDSLGLPFYDWVTPETMPNGFCICVGGLSCDADLICPGVVHSAE
jgi:hypothetical protein